MKQKTEIFEELYARYPALEPCAGQIEKAFGLLLDCAESGGLIMACGNGGSAADAEHTVGELMKGFLLARPLNRYQKEDFEDIEGGREVAEKLQRGVRAVSLVSQTALITACENDIGADCAFAQQVYNYAGSASDVLLAFSTSGSSKNVVNAAIAAKAAGVRTVAVTGQTGGRLKDLAEVTVKLPALEPYAVQEYTLPVYHALCAAVEAELFGD